MVEDARGEKHLARKEEETRSGRKDDEELQSRRQNSDGKDQSYPIGEIYD
jgi:hypothetical protein